VFNAIIRDCIVQSNTNISCSDFLAKCVIVESINPKLDLPFNCGLITIRFFDQQPDAYDTSFFRDDLAEFFARCIRQISDGRRGNLHPHAFAGVNQKNISDDFTVTKRSPVSPEDLPLVDKRRDEPNYELSVFLFAVRVSV